MLAALVRREVGKIPQPRDGIYSAGSDGWPDALEWAPDLADVLSGATATYVSHSLDFTFDTGRTYWLGVKCGASATTTRAINVSSAMNLGISGATATSYYTAIQRVTTIDTAWETSWGFNPVELVANVSPTSIRMRCAAP